MKALQARILLLMTALQFKALPHLITQCRQKTAFTILIFLVPLHLESSILLPPEIRFLQTRIRM